MTTAKNKIGWIFVIALLIRLILVYPQYSGDIRNHLVWASEFVRLPFGFYDRHFAGFNDANYPPLAIFLFAISNLLLSFAKSASIQLNNSLAIFPSLLIPFINSENTQMAVLKLPGILADVGVGYLIYLITNKRQCKHPLLITCLYLFNPAVIYLSAVWGQIEPVTTFFILLSLYTSFYSPQKYKWLSICIFACASLVKQTALWFLPIFLFIWYFELSLKDIIRGILFAVVVFFISYLPFGFLPSQSIHHYLSTLEGSSNVIADAAWNVWYFVFGSFTISDSLQIGPLTIRQLSVASLIVVLFIVIRQLYPKYTRESIFNMLFIWSLAVFFLQTRVHERHLAFSIPFLLLTTITYPAYFTSYFFLSLYHLSNLIFSLKLPFF